MIAVEKEIGNWGMLAKLMSEYIFIYCVNN